MAATRIRWSVRFLLAAAFFAALFVAGSDRPATAQEPAGFACSSYENHISWSDNGQSRYWVYKSTDGGTTYNWVGRTLGETTLVDATPQVGAIYQVHYQGIARVACEVTKPVVFACSSFGGRVTWSDVGQERYWVYKSTDQGASYDWASGNDGATTTWGDADTTDDALYQVRHPNRAPQFCTDWAPELEPPSESFECTNRNGVLTWTDKAQTRYWLYRAVIQDDGTVGPFEWLGRTVGATTFTDADPAPNVVYQVHYAGIARQPCYGIGRVLLEGESTTATPWYTAHVAKHLPGSADIENHGTGGQTITQINNNEPTDPTDPNFKPVVLPAGRPGQLDVAVLWIGINDVATARADRTPTRIYDEMTDWANARRDEGWDRIVVMTVTRFDNTANRPHLDFEYIDQRRRNLNDLIVANSMGADRVIDLRSVAGVGDAFRTQDQYWRYDQTHLSPRATGTVPDRLPEDNAYAVIGEIVGRTIDGLLAP